jgi:hypothetical protein
VAGDSLLFFFNPNRLTKWRDYEVLFFYPDQAAMRAQQHLAVKIPDYVLQYAAWYFSCGGTASGSITAEIQ